MNISKLFLAAAKKYPNKIAIFEKEKSISFAQLEKEVKNTAAYFNQKGILKGDRVLVFVPMGIDLYRIVLALFYLGATAVFLDEWVSKKRMEICCKNADCKGFIGIFKARVLSFFSKELRKIPVKLSLKKVNRNQNIPIAEVEENASALITFTTGSTGKPKAANRSHAFLKAQFEVLIEEINPEPNDIDMPILPIVLFVNLGIGCSSVIAQFKSKKPIKNQIEKIANQIQKHQVTRIVASPFLIKKLAEHSIENKIKFPRLKKIFTGGAPVFPSEAKLYLQAFPDAVSKIVYGSTEAEPISSIEAKSLIKRSIRLLEGLPVGKIFYKTQLKIIPISEKAIPELSDKEFKNLELKTGKMGEIIVAGNHVLKSYFRNEKAFEENKIKVGKTIWHRTGDSGFVEKENLFLTGRCKQIIETKKDFISPFIIENQLQNLKGIDLGTVLEINEKIVLVLETSQKANDLKPQLKNVIFDEIKTVKKIPRDLRHNSKIDYPALKQMIK